MARAGRGGVYPRPYIPLLSALVLAGCAHRIPLPPHLAVSGIAELQARMRQAAPRAQRYVAEAQLYYVGTDMRLRGTATVAVQRPASLRWDLYGPHGGVLRAFASNGHELQLMDVGATRFVYGAATRVNFERLMPVAALPLDGQGWTTLLFGEVELPSDARLTYNEETGLFEATWSASGASMEVHINPETARWVTLHVAASAKDWGHVTLDARDGTGLPRKLRIRTATADLQVELLDLVVDGDAPTPEAFQLDLPEGFDAEHLGH